MVGEDETPIKYAGERPGQVFRHTGATSKIRQTASGGKTDVDAVRAY
ncbi:MAG: hypothetical protein HZB29_00965 [Nitrospinae bacterium]|nr:hypothetical protein [Nitrospinota bacterium]